MRPDNDIGGHGPPYGTEPARSSMAANNAAMAPETGGPCLLQWIEDSPAWRNVPLRDLRELDVSANVLYSAPTEVPHHNYTP